MIVEYSKKPALEVFARLKEELKYLQGIRLYGQTYTRLKTKGNKVYYMLMVENEPPNFTLTIPKGWAITKIDTSHSAFSVSMEPIA